MASAVVGAGQQIICDNILIIFVHFQHLLSIYVYRFVVGDQSSAQKCAGKSISERQHLQSLVGCKCVNIDLFCGLLFMGPFRPFSFILKIGHLS